MQAVLKGQCLSPKL